MGFFNRLEKVDGAINRGYARWGKKIWLSLGLAVVLYGGWIVWAAIWGPPTGGVTLIIHNQLDRPIRGFCVNGVAGGNASVRDKSNPYSLDRGGAACCGNINGKTAKIKWTVDYTLAQYNAGVRTETHQTVMPLPKRKWGENYLHVYFYPGDQVRLWWSTGFGSPKAEVLIKNNQ
jgi:hypothetical protein